MALTGPVSCNSTALFLACAINLLVASNAIPVMCYKRLEDQAWHIADYVDLAAVIPLTALDLELPLTEIYPKRHLCL